MRQGFIRVAAVTPELKVADTAYNGEKIREYMKETAAAGAKLVVFPELCITGYTCGDLFLQERLLNAAREELLKIAACSRSFDIVCFVGLPFAVDGKLYNMAAVVAGGKVLGMVPKTYLPNYSEFYELRHFASGAGMDYVFSLEGEPVLAGTGLLFVCDDMPELKIGVEICEDLWAPNPPSTGYALSGASVIVNLSASNEVAGKADYRRSLVSGQSARLVCGYVYASAGEGESTQDVVFSGHDMIAENGHMLAEKRFSCGVTYGELDLQSLLADRRRMNTFDVYDRLVHVNFRLTVTETKLTGLVDPMPFVPKDPGARRERCEEMLTLQALGLKKRMAHTNSKTAVIGVSGGLDSTLALLVTAKAFDMLGKDRSDMIAVTMPGFGTTDRTYDNAVKLIRCLGARFVEVDIKESVRVHFAAIGHDMSSHDVTYENGQARERTQILMDIANMQEGLVIGTGDLSELALGWATYNGDHMSMYAVNASVPKTLVRHLVEDYADTCGDKELRETLSDVLDTPVSPELLPPEEGVIAQKTEDLVGPYDLHDFFLYQVLRFGFSPAKVYRLAKLAFAERYESDFVLKWLKTFYRRFFAQQFKRSCLPDGPKVGTVAVSPRGDLRMPSDASAGIWMQELEKLQ